MNPNDFNTRIELRDYVVDLIKKVGITDSLKENYPDEYEFFKLLFQRHPEKDKKEVDLIDDIYVKPYIKANIKFLEITSHQFIIIKNNNTSDSISWVKCVNCQDTSIGIQLYRAMRSAISKQICYFKRMNKNKPCELCGALENLTVDHIIKFKKLKNDFLNLYPNYPTKFENDSNKDVIFCEKDFKYKELWRKYHYINAKLRILCMQCNRRLDNYGYNNRRQKPTF